MANRPQALSLRSSPRFSPIYKPNNLNSAASPPTESPTNDQPQETTVRQEDEPSTRNPPPVDPLRQEPT